MSVGNFGPNQLAEGNLRNVIGAGMVNAAFQGGSGQPFVRFVVDEVVFDPSELDDERLRVLKEEYGLGEVPFLDRLPANSVFARPILAPESGLAKPMVLFPFFPSHVQLPVKAGEHVWAFFEGDSKPDHGFWVCRITEPRTVEDVNFTHADRKFQPSGSSTKTKDKFEGKGGSIPGFDNGAVIGEDSPRSTASISGERNAYEKILKESDSSKVSEMEMVPRKKKRPGDFVLQGSHNAAIVIGTDRTGRTAEFEKTSKGKRAKGKPLKDSKDSAGTIDMSVGFGQEGRPTAPKKIKNTLNNQETDKDLGKENTQEGDPDFEGDVGRFYLSMKTKADENFNINIKGIPQDKGEIAAGVIKIDHMRIIARKSIKFMVQPTMNSSESECGAIVIKANGDVVFVPSDTGYVLLGGHDASQAIATHPLAAPAGGQVIAPPMVSTLGSQTGLGGPNGSYSKKCLIK